MRRLPSLLFINLGHGFSHFLMLIYPTVVIALAPAVDRPYGELLALSTAGFVAFGAGTLPAGWLADRWSRRGMMLLFYFGSGVAAVLTGLAQSHLAIAAGLGLIGLFASIYHPVGIAIVAEEGTRAGAVGRVLGVNGVYGNLGVAAAPVVAAALAEMFGWRAAFIVPGAAAILTGLAYARGTGGGEPAPPTATTRLDPASARSAVAPWRIIVPLAIATLCGGLIFNAVVIALPKLFDARLGAGTTGVGALVSGVFAAAAFAQIVTGRLIDALPFRRFFIVLVLAQVPLLAAAAVAGGPALVVASLALVALIFGEIPLHDTLVARHVPGPWRARAYAVKYVGSLGVAAVAVPLIALSHRETGDLTALFVAMAGLAVLVALAGTMLPRGLPPRYPIW